MRWLQRWLAERSYRRHHHPYLVLRELPGGSGLQGIWCTKHGRWIDQCPQAGSYQPVRPNG